MQLHGLQRCQKWLNMGNDHWPDYIYRSSTNSTFLCSRTYAIHNNHQPLAPYPTCLSFTNTDLRGISIRPVCMRNDAVTPYLYHTTKYLQTDLSPTVIDPSVNILYRRIYHQRCGRRGGACRIRKQQRGLVMPCHWPGIVINYGRTCRSSPSYRYGIRGS